MAKKKMNLVKATKEAVRGKGSKGRNIALLAAIGAAVIVGGNWVKKKVRGM